MLLTSFMLRYYVKMEKGEIKKTKIIIFKKHRRPRWSIESAYKYFYFILMVAQTKLA